MLQVRPFRQRPRRCGPASLKIVLDYYGIRKSEQELAALSGCTPSIGTSAEGLIRAAEALGLTGWIKDNAHLSDLTRFVARKKTPVIVDWFAVDEGHYSVVTGIDKENIYLQDPSLGHLRALKRSTFKAVWFDFPGPFLQSKDDLILRRMVVIHPLAGRSTPAPSLGAKRAG